MSVLLGLLAAFAWGVHDLCVRFVAPGRAVMPLMAVVLAVGLAPLLALTVWHGGWRGIGLREAGLAAAAGVAFVVAGGGLYRAFAIGPVALVAPVIGSYPILTILAAMLAGRPPAFGQALAILIVVIGVGLVASLSPAHAEAAGGTRGQAMVWAVASGTGFAATFALAQAAAQAGAPEGEWAKMAITRAVALALACAVIAARPPAPAIRALPWRLLFAMGLLDAGAMAAVTLAAGLPHPEFAAVAASVFGVMTVLLARLLLSEPVRPPQWAAILTIFAAIAYLGL